ncbi:ABC transporter permease subunit [Azospirillum doebereinerae]
MQGLDTVVSNIGIASLLALSTYVLLKAGLLSLGQQAMFGAGAYGGGLLTTGWDAPLWAGWACGALAGAVAGLPLAWIAARRGTTAFTLSSLFYAELTRFALTALDLGIERDGGPVGPAGLDGFGGIRAALEQGWSDGMYATAVMAMVALAVAFLVLLERRRSGRRIQAVGNDPILAAGVGIDVARVRFAVVGLSGAIAGLAGSAYAHHTTFLDPASFSIMLGVHGMAYAVVGGIGSPVGPLLGAVLDFGLFEAFRPLAQYRMIAFGGLIALLLLFRPQGLLSPSAVRRMTAARKRRLPCGLIVLAFAATALSAGTGHAAPPLRAEAVECAPTGAAFEIRCVIDLRWSQDGRPMDPATVTVSADMPSMPMAHAVRPVAATQDGKPGLYAARLVLPMNGEWVLRFGISSPVREVIHLRQCLGAACQGEKR